MMAGVVIRFYQRFNGKAMKNVELPWEKYYRYYRGKHQQVF